MDDNIANILVNDIIKEIADNIASIRINNITNERANNMANSLAMVSHWNLMRSGHGAPCLDSYGFILKSNQI